MNFADELEGYSKTSAPMPKKQSTADELESLVQTRPQPEVTPTSTYENQFPGDIDVPPQNATPADWFSPQQKALRRQQYILSKKSQMPEENWANKVSAMLEAGGGTISTTIASIPAIPYGVFNAIKNTAEGKKPDTENEIFNAIHALTPDFLLPKTHLGQKYMANIGTALQGMPVLGAEGAAISSGANLAAQFGRARIGIARSGKEPILIAPLTKLSQDKQIHNTNYDLHQKIASAEQNGTVNPEVAQRHISVEQLPEVISQEDGRKIKMRLSEGDATRDSALWSNERNERAMSPDMRQLIKDNSEAPPLILDQFKSQVAPNTSFSSTPEAGNYLINKLQDVRNKNQNITSSDYQALHDVAEQSGLGDKPLDSTAFAKDVEARFKKLGMYHEDLPNWLQRRTQEIASGDYPITFKNFEQLRSDLGMEQRDLAKSNASGASRSLRAVNEIRDALENMPLTPEAQILKPLADKARASAKRDFDLQRLSPAYRAVVNGDAKPDDFVQSYIFGKNKNTGVNELQNLLNMFPDDKDFHQTLAWLRLDDIKKEASTANGKITASKFNNALAKGEDRGMDRMLFDEKILPFPINHGLENLKKAINWTTVAPEGSYVQGNPHVIAKVGNYISSGMGAGVTKLLNVVTPGIKAGDLMAQRFEAVKQQKMATKSTEVGAGLTYKSKK